MRLSESASVSRRRDNALGGLRTRKKHKRLDAICETLYTRNHNQLEREIGDSRVVSDSADHESELRRSTRARRPPIVLDASPSPAKKRRKIDKAGLGVSVGRGKLKDGIEIELPSSASNVADEEPDNWRSRLRSRDTSAMVGSRDNGDSPPTGRRILFVDLNVSTQVVKSGENLLESEEQEAVKSTVVKSKRPGRIKASNVRNMQQENELHFRKDGQGDNADEPLEDSDDDEQMQLNCSGYTGRADEKDDVTTTFGDAEERKAQSSVRDGDCIGIEDVELEEQDKQVEVPDNVLPGEQFKQVELEKAFLPNDNLEPVEKDKQKSLSPVSVGEHKQGDAEDGVPANSARVIGDHNKHLNDVTTAEVDTGKLRIKEGRKCGLCGTGTDGKPPKKSLGDGAGSDNEVYSGSSVSEEPNYDMWDGFGHEPGWLGCLLGPINDRFGIAGIWVHQHCAV